MCKMSSICAVYSREATSQVAMLAWIFGDCREGQRPRACCAGILMPRQLAAGSLTLQPAMHIPVLSFMLLYN